MHLCVAVDVMIFSHFCFSDIYISIFFTLSITKFISSVVGRLHWHMMTFSFLLRYLCSYSKQNITGYLYMNFVKLFCCKVFCFALYQH